MSDDDSNLSDSVVLMTMSSLSQYQIQVVLCVFSGNVSARLFHETTERI